MNSAAGMNNTGYRGRFAPSPTGPLHFGSLIAAMASYLQAKVNHGEWWLRIEDIDPPREQPGASDAIIKTLAAFGFEWDGPIRYQSAGVSHYHEILDHLRERDLLYACGCSRKDIAKLNDNNIYPGTCRAGLPPGREARAWRVRSEGRIQYQDAIQGQINCDIAIEAGDFVLLRADGLVAYQLAVGLDDAEQGMTEVIRGADLLDSTPRQIYIQQLLQLPSPRYAHHPVAVNAAEDKLCKHSHAPAIQPKDAVPLLWQALDFLGQRPEKDLKNGDLNDLWHWAITHWQLQEIPKLRTSQVTETGISADK